MAEVARGDQLYAFTTRLATLQAWVPAEEAEVGARQYCIEGYFRFPCLAGNGASKHEQWYVAPTEQRDTVSLNQAAGESSRFSIE